MKIKFISGREPTYTRNEVILNGLRSNGVEVIECTSNVKNYLLRNVIVMFKFLFSSWNYDVNFVGFLGQPLVLFVKFFSNKKIFFDAFLSTYETMCFDRKKYRFNSFMGKIYFWLDKKSCSLSKVVFLDTQQHSKYFIDTFGLDAGKFQSLYIGANDKVFFPNYIEGDGKFNVLWYGEYQTLHGLEYMVRAAKQLESHSDIHFIFAGKGLIKREIDKLAASLGVKNITFYDWIPRDELANYVNKSSICLGGHFGLTLKAKLVIAGKTYQFIGCKKATIVGENESNKELLTHLRDCYFVKMGSADELAKAILFLKENNLIRESIALNGYNLFKDKCNPEAIGKKIIEVIKNGMDPRTKV